MDDILASIRRILSEDETSDAADTRSPATPQPGVLVLDPAMMVQEPGFEPEPAQASPSFMQARESGQDGLVGATTHAATASSVGSLVRTLSTVKGTAINRGGPTLEDMVREEMRPLLKEWLDANLPTLVERLVQAEIERVIKANA